MNMSLLKLITILCCLIGGICGLFAMIPYIGGLMFFLLMCMSSVTVMLFLMKTGVLKIESVPESITIGGIIGFLSFIAFSIVYMPLVIILIRVFKYYTNFGVAIFLGHANLFVIITMMLFLAVLSAAINAFTGFLVYYITELLKNMNNR